MQVVASLLPRQVQMKKLTPLADITDEELAELELHLAASRAKLVQKLNGIAIAPEPEAKQLEK